MITNYFRTSKGFPSFRINRHRMFVRENGALAGNSLFQRLARRAGRIRGQSWTMWCPAYLAYYSIDRFPSVWCRFENVNKQLRNEGDWFKAVYVPLTPFQFSYSFPYQNNRFPDSLNVCDATGATSFDCIISVSGPHRMKVEVIFQSWNLLRTICDLPRGSQCFPILQYNQLKVIWRKALIPIKWLTSLQLARSGKESSDLVEHL